MLIIVNKNPSAFFYSKATYRLPERDNKQKDTRIQKKSVKLAIQRDTTAKIAHKIFILSHFPLFAPARTYYTLKLNAII